MANGTGTLQGRSLNWMDDRWDADTLITIVNIQWYMEWIGMMHINTFIFVTCINVRATCQRLSFWNMSLPTNCFVPVSHPYIVVSTWQDRRLSGELPILCSCFTACDRADEHLRSRELLGAIDVLTEIQFLDSFRKSVRLFGIGLPATYLRDR